MPKRVKITQREVLRELKNNSDFSLNTGDTTKYLNSNTKGRVQVKYRVELEAYLNISSYEIYENTTNVSYTILTNVGDFVQDCALNDGDTVFINVGDDGTGQFRGSADVEFVTSDELRLNNIVQNSGSYAGPAGSLPTGIFSEQPADYVFNTSDFLAINYRFGLIENDESFNTISKISNVTNEYSAQLGGAPSLFVDGSYNGVIKSGQSGSFKFRRVAKQINNRFTADGATPGAIEGLHVYELEHIFRVHPWYRDGEDDDLLSGVAPEDIAKGSKSLKYAIEIDLRRNLNDPNSPLTVKDDGQQNKGNVGWFNENLNNLPTQYSFSNVVYQNLTDATTATTIEVGKRTKVSFLVNSAGGTFTASQPFLFGHSKRASATDYQNSGLTLDEVFVCETVRATIGDPAVTTGQIIRSLQATLNSPNEILVEAEIEFQAPEIGRVNDGDSYTLSIEVADDTLQNFETDATNLLIDAQDYEVNNDIPGLLAWEEMDLYTHPVPFDDGVSQGFTDLQQWNEDGIMVDHGFTLDRVEGAVLEGLTYRLVAFKDENTFTDLDSATFSLKGAVIDGEGNQQIEINETRSFNLADEDQFNWKRISTGVFASPNMPYSTQVAFKFPWQEWISLVNAPGAFYNKNEPQNGLNKKTSRYSDVNGYQIRVIAEATVSQNGVNTIYRKSTNDLRVRDYNENDGTAPDWTGVIETFTDVGNPTNGVILADQPTFLKATFTPDVPFGPDPLLYWGVFRIETTENPSLSIYELSSIWDSVEGNLLVPLDGETRLKISVVSGDVVLECKTDPNRIIDGKGHKLSARFGLLDGSLPAIPTSFIRVSLNVKDNADISGNKRRVAVFQQNEQMFNTSIESQYFDFDNTSLLYKVSLSDPGLNGWTAVSYVTFGDFQTFLQNNSSGYAYIETTDTGFVDGGIEVRYDRLLTSTTPQTATLTWSDDIFDIDQTLWLDKPIQNLSNTNSVNIPEVRYQVVTANPATEDWTDFSVPDLPSLEAITSIKAEGVKYGIRFAIEKSAKALGSFDFNFEYVDQQDVMFNFLESNTNTGYYRDWQNAVIWNQGVEYGRINNDAGLISLFNYASLQPITISFEVEIANVTGANQDLIATQGLNGLFCRIFGGSNPRNIRFGFFQSGSVFILADFNHRIKAGSKYQFVFTYNGGGTSNDFELYINSVKQQSVNRLTSGSISTSVPGDGFYYHGASLGDGFNASDSFAKTHNIAIWDRVLTPLEIRRLHNDLEYPAAGLFRKYEFGQGATATIVDTSPAATTNFENIDFATVLPVAPTRASFI